MQEKINKIFFDGRAIQHRINKKHGSQINICIYIYVVDIYIYIYIVDIYGWACLKMGVARNCSISAYFFKFRALLFLIHSHIYIYIYVSKKMFCNNGNGWFSSGRKANTG